MLSSNTFQILTHGKLLWYWRNKTFYSCSNNLSHASFLVRAQPCCVLFHTCCIGPLMINVVVDKLNFVIWLHGWPSIHNQGYSIQATCCLQMSHSVGNWDQQIKYRALLSTGVQLFFFFKNLEVLQMADGVYTMRNTISFTHKNKHHTKVRTKQSSTAICSVNKKIITFSRAWKPRILTTALK